MELKGLGMRLGAIVYNAHSAGPSEMYLLLLSPRDGTEHVST